VAPCHEVGAGGIRGIVGGQHGCKTGFEFADIGPQHTLFDRSDLRRMHGMVEIGGSLQAPRSVRVEATVESLLWKGSARDPLLALPSPLKADIAMKGTGGASPRLDVTKGVVFLGPLKSELRGSIALPPSNAPATPMRLDLTISGAPQDIRSSDPAFRALAAASPATWSTKASWDIKIGGTPEAMVQNGKVTLKPVLVESGPNKFALDQVAADWSVTPDRRFTAQARGGGSGLTLGLDAKGSTEPGGESNGTFQLDAPAARLNDPRAVAVDSRGNAYIADYGNHAIRMVVGGALP